MNDTEKDPLEENKRLKKLLKNCVNELCYKCGSYENEHLGSCNGCRWKEVRHGDDS